MSDTLPDIRFWLQAEGLMARKALGQHFLLDPSFPTKIASIAGDLSHTHVIEIGPGPTVLTRALLEAGAKHVTAIEKDARFVPLLQALQHHYPTRFAYMNADALAVDAMKIGETPRQIIANLPYNVGTEMLLRWLKAIGIHGDAAYTQLVLMFQKEVVERITSAVDEKSYGRLSVLAQWLCDTHSALFVPAGAFSPPPKVDSAVIVLRPKPLSKRLPADIKAMQQVTQAAFGQRRKMLRGALKSLNVETELLLEKAGIAPTARAETIDIEGFVRLANAFSELSKN